ncbi:MAG: hypothetical protein JKY52_19375 [Flavobacteriales bacterium]|nr:hypothetical protein [Flavobacteriales bacterium]
MASQYGTQFKTNAELLEEMKMQARAQQQATIQANISRASTPEEIAGTGIGNFLGALGGAAWDKYGPAPAPTQAQQNATARAGVLGNLGGGGAPQGSGFTQGQPSTVSKQGGIAGQAQSVLYANKAKELQAAMKGASPENQGIYQQMSDNLMVRSLDSKKLEDAEAASAFATKSNNINANNFGKRGYWDLSDAVIGGTMEMKDAMTEGRARDKAAAALLKEKKADLKPAKNQFLKNEDGSFSVVNNAGKVVNTVADPAAAKKAVKAHNSLMTSLAGTDSTMKNITQMGVLAGQENAAGTSYGAFKHVPNTDSYRLANKVETLKANLTFDKLASMRANSKDGSSGLGQVAVVEINLLGSVVQNLDPSVGTEAFQEQLDAVQFHYDNYRNILLGKPPNIDWEDEAYKENTRVDGSGQRWFKDASGKLHKV